MHNAYNRDRLELYGKSYWLFYYSVYIPIDGGGQEILNLCREYYMQILTNLLPYCDKENEVPSSFIIRYRHLKKINLSLMLLTDDHILTIVEALRGQNMPEELLLAGNLIGSKGCQAIASLLSDSNSTLQLLNLYNNNIGNIGANAIIDSLSGNNKLRELSLDGNHPMFENHSLTDQSIHDAFSQLCNNTSSINNTYLSNHTLSSVPGVDIEHLLKLNTGTNKHHVAIKKILKYHPDIDMSTLFDLVAEDEENLKALPFVISWFDKAKEVTVEDSYMWPFLVDEDWEGDEILDTRKLSSIYQFAVVMPLLFVPISSIKRVVKK